MLNYIIVSFLSLCFLSTPLRAESERQLRLSLGLAALEEGDDRQRPALGLSADFKDLYTANAYYWGRDQGPFHERNVLVSAMRSFVLAEKLHLTGALGVGFLWETLKLTYSDAPQDNDQELNYNLGLAVRFAWQYDIGPSFVFLHWDSYIFPAGINGGLLLSTGRKQLIKAGIGVSI